MTTALSRRAVLAGAATLLVAKKPAFAKFSSNGDITIVSFVDYQCPSCKASYAQLEPLLARDPGLRLITKDWPILGAASEQASELVLAAAHQGKHREAMNALMHARGGLTARRTAKLLADAGVDIAQAIQYLAANAGEIATILANNADQARRLGLRGTPAFIVGPTLFERSLDQRQFQLAVERARAAA